VLKDERSDVVNLDGGMTRQVDRRLLLAMAAFSVPVMSAFTKEIMFRHTKGGGEGPRGEKNVLFIRIKNLVKME
jgi:hypothetical protein